MNTLGPGQLRKVQRGGGPARWVLTWTAADGKRHRKGLSTDHRVAERMRADLINRRDLERAGLGGEAGLDRQLRELVDAYLADLATRCCPHHVLNTRIGLADVLAAVPVERVGDLRPIQMIEYRAKRLAEGASARTANLACDRLRACLNWAVQLDLIARNPIQKLPRLKETEATARYRRRALSEVEITAFLAAAAEDDRAIAGDGSLRGVPRVPQHAFWRALLETGARYGELVAVRWADLDLEQRVLHLRAATTKAQRSRSIPILAGLAEELRGLRDDHVRVLRRPLRPDDRVFLSPRGCPMPAATVNVMRVFDRLLEAAGIDRVDAQGRKLDIHAMRHSAATRFARAGVPLQQTQRILGHADPKLTAAIYSHLEVEDLRGAVARLEDGAWAEIQRPAHAARTYGVPQPSIRAAILGRTPASPRLHAPASSRAPESLLALQEHPG